MLGRVDGDALAGSGFHSGLAMAGETLLVFICLWRRLSRSHRRTERQNQANQRNSSREHSYTLPVNSTQTTKRKPVLSIREQHRIDNPQHSAESHG